jgi:hypothetical protein
MLVPDPRDAGHELGRHLVRFAGRGDVRVLALPRQRATPAQTRAAERCAAPGRGSARAGAQGEVEHDGQHDRGDDADQAAGGADSNGHEALEGRSDACYRVRGVRAA